MKFIEAVRELDDLANVIGRTRDAEAIREVLLHAAWMRTRLLRIAKGESQASDMTVARTGLDGPPSRWRGDHEVIERDAVRERESRGTLKWE